MPAAAAAAAATAVDSDSLNTQRNKLLGNILYAVVGIVVFIQLVTGIITSARTSSYDHGESQAPVAQKPPTMLKTWLRRRLILPALFGRKHIQPLGYYQLPTRGQTLMVTGYMMLNAILLGMDYAGQGRTIKAVSDRAGHLALVNMPLFFLFAGRNNIAIWVTGWPQRDFQVFHKWIARIATLEAVIHSAGYGYIAIHNNWKHTGVHQDFAWISGIAATAVISAMLCFSITSMRKRWYELFLVLHILGAVLFLVFLYNHITLSHPAYRAYVWVCVAIWALDRGLRVVRLVIFNRRGRHNAKVKLIPGTNTLRLLVYPNIRDIGFAPGAHYFLYLPDRWCFWESHPFTAAAWRTHISHAPEKVMVALQKISEPGLGSPESSGDSSTKKIGELSPGVDVDEDEQARKRSHKKRRKDSEIIVTTSNPGAQRAKLTFLIHVRNGMTQELLQRVLVAPNRVLELPCLLEGPYGIARPVHMFPTVIAVAGGVGMSTTLPYLQQHLSTRLGVTQRFVLIWSVREGALAETILATVRGLEFRTDVAVRVYITRAKEGDSFKLPVGVRVKYRRPRIEDIIRNEARSRVPGTPIAVVACGGAAVVDCARKGVVVALEGAGGSKGSGEIVYWEESYGW